MNLYDELVTLIDRWDHAGVQYALCGGLAVAIHGYPRFTRDVDMLLPPDQVRPATAEATALGYGSATGPIFFDRDTDRERCVHRVTKIEGAESPF